MAARSETPRSILAPRASSWPSGASLIGRRFLPAVRSAIAAAQRAALGLRGSAARTGSGITRRSARPMTRATRTASQSFVRPGARARARLFHAEGAGACRRRCARTALSRSQGRSKPISRSARRRGSKGFKGLAKDRAAANAHPAYARRGRRGKADTQTHSGLAISPWRPRQSSRAPLVREGPQDDADRSGGYRRREGAPRDGKPDPDHPKGRAQSRLSGGPRR